MSQEKPQPKLVATSVYVLIDENSTILPNAHCEFVTEKDLPDTGNYYVITKQGIVLHKETQIIDANVKVPGISFLGELHTKAKLKLPRIPSTIIARSHEFFQRIWDSLKSESELMMMYNQETQEYDLWCPEQEVSSGSVHYETPMEELEKFRQGDQNWRWVGTIHSHCNFSAYHSGVDTDDERHVDGVHITLGHVDGDDFSMVSSVAINKQRWQLPPENVCKGMARSESRFGSRIFASQDEYFRPVMTDDETEKFYNVYEPQIGNEWVPKVKKQVWQNRGTHGSTFVD